MAKKQNYWYVLVLTNEGPKFVTKVNYQNKTAEWNKLEKPLEMSKSEAQDLTIGLNCNLNVSFAVCQPFELECQPYLYDRGHFEWKYNEEEEEKKDEEGSND